MDLKEKIDDLERKLLEERINSLEEKIEKITKSRMHVVANVERDMKHLDVFFDKHIVEKKDNKIKTVDVLKKVNEFAAPMNLRFSKFEVSKYILGRKIIRKKIGSHNYYIDIELIE